VQVIKADTEVKVVIGPAVAVADGFTPVTTLTVSAADEAELMKHDAASVVDISGNTIAAITSMDGYYNLTLSATDTDTEGMITIGINDDSLMLPILARFMVMKAQPFDSFFGSDVLQVDVIEASATQAEPAQSNPGSNISWLDKIGFMYKCWRNKVTNDGTDIKMFDDAGTTVDQKAPVAESGGTVTRSEWVSGP